MSNRKLQQQGAKRNETAVAVLHTRGVPAAAAVGAGEKGDEGHEQLWEKLLTMLLVINIYSRVESSRVECSSPLRPCACVYECVGVCARVCVLVKNL